MKEECKKCGRVFREISLYSHTCDVAVLQETGASIAGLSPPVPPSCRTTSTAPVPRPPGPILHTSPGKPAHERTPAGGDSTRVASPRFAESRVTEEKEDRLSLVAPPEWLLLRVSSARPGQEARTDTRLI